jgi:hypothetical protein
MIHEEAGTLTRSREGKETAVSMFRQGLIVAFVLGTMLNAWVLGGAVGGYKYYGNVFPLDATGAEQFALRIEIALVVMGAFAWWLSRPKSRQP